ncbi:MAG TPA: HipA N-terminal domain-containing protein [Chthoniobacterales bacterium]|nr:HipA N-terminal domain-containing protein [Chthoniobacterales bacterium]
MISRLRQLRQLVADWLDDIPADAADQEPIVFSVMLDDLEVGRLRLEAKEWVFSYSDAFRAQRKIKPIVDFPNLEREYRSADLWPFFLLRIPSLKQPAVQEFLREENVGKPNAVLLLKRFGKRSAANPFELVPAEARG